MRKPEWLRIKKTGIYDSNIATERLIHQHKLHTVCESAQCPNKGECFNKRTATFMVLGNICTRTCSFCAVNKKQSLLEKPDPEEPRRIVQAIQELQLDYIVITMVTRDDLPDGGALHLIRVLRTIQQTAATGKELPVEVLVSDLQGNFSHLEKILGARPAVFNHNIETIDRLYPQVRPQASYTRSLRILKHAKQFAPDIPTKSGFMLGLGETRTDIITLMKDLLEQGVDILTIGQYLAPSKKHYPVYDYIEPEQFEYYQQQAIEMGFKVCFSAPFVRSSYRAKEALSIKKRTVTGKVEEQR